MPFGSRFRVCSSFSVSFSSVLPDFIYLACFNYRTLLWHPLAPPCTLLHPPLKCVGVAGCVIIRFPLATSRQAHSGIPAATSTNLCSLFHAYGCAVPSHPPPTLVCRRLLLVLVATGRQQSYLGYTPLCMPQQPLGGIALCKSTCFRLSSSTKVPAPHHTS